MREGQPVPLTPKAFEMLVVLISQSGSLLTKEELLRAVWADTVVEENNLDKNISALRKALGDRGSERRLIETVRGLGYRFNPQVTEIVFSPNETAAPVSAEVQPTVVQAPSPTPASSFPPGKEFLLRRGWLLLGLILIAPVLTLAFVWRSWPGWGRMSETPRVINVTRLTNGGYINNAALSPDGGSFVYTERDGAITRLWWRQVGGGQPLLLTAPEAIVLGLTFAPDGQSIYYAAVDPANVEGALFRVPVSGGNVTRLLTRIVSPVTFAPDGQRLAFIRVENDGTVLEASSSLVVANSTGGEERVVLTREGQERLASNGPSWSPDGQEIACQVFSGLTSSGDHVYRVVRINVTSGALRLLTTQLWDGCGRVVWLRDGRGLVMVGTRQGESDTTARDAVWFIPQPEGPIRRITTDLSRHFYSSVSVTDDGQSLVVIPFNRNSQIWSVEARGQGSTLRYDAASAVQMTSGTSEGRGGLTSLNDGSVVYVARTGDHVDLWRIHGEGGTPQQLTTDPPFLEEVSAPPDGRYLVFASKRAGLSHLFRVNQDGTNLQQVTRGESREIESDCSPDGQWIVYSSQTSVPGQIATFKLWKLPAAGGAPVKLGDHEALAPHFSPDGRWISYLYADTPGHWRAAIISSEGGNPVQTFAVPNAAEWNVGYRWTPDGQALTYIVKGKTFDNVWQQPLHGQPARALTNFNSGEIYNYAFSRDGQRLYLARGYSIRDVLLIKNFR